MYTMFCSTYICDSVFSKMNNIKNKLRYQLINEHLITIKKIVYINYTHDFKTCHFPQRRICFTLFPILIISLHKIINLNDICIDFCLIMYEICTLNLDGPQKLSRFLILYFKTINYWPLIYDVKRTIGSLIFIKYWL